MVSQVFLQGGEEGREKTVEFILLGSTLYTYLPNLLRQVSLKAENCFTSPSCFLMCRALIPASDQEDSGWIGRFDN